ncbi:hypothetical protein QUA43_28770 [Microcoleus sp. N9_B4]|uniref:hypothetical protein n=1 Tax=Microcoleus sp. N9_B4 TaxID=3055386 RepID=UPI002FD1204C
MTNKVFEYDKKRHIIVVSIYELTKQRKNEFSSFDIELSTSDIKNDIKSKVELVGLDLYVILDKLKEEGWITVIKSLENLRALHSTDAVISMTEKAFLYMDENIKE